MCHKATKPIDLFKRVIEIYIRFSKRLVLRSFEPRCFPFFFSFFLFPCVEMKERKAKWRVLYIMTRWYMGNNPTFGPPNDHSYGVGEGALDGEKTS